MKPLRDEYGQTGFGLLVMLALEVACGTLFLAVACLVIITTGWDGALLGIVLGIGSAAVGMIVGALLYIAVDR